MAQLAPGPFLTAEWRYLAMLNFVADPKLLAPLVPVGTELDFDGGETFVSVVGFRFLNTRVLGWGIPLHRDFEEVNLRFYVRRKAADGWRRGVAFVRELVPRRAIAFIARVFYDEPYLALPMRHLITVEPAGLSVMYEWRRRGRWEGLAITTTERQPRYAAAGSHEEFITEHYWGYTARRAGTSEYAVEHERWRLWPAATWKFDADVETLYGANFVSTLAAQPFSAFIAEGSTVMVRPRRIQLTS